MDHAISLDFPEHVDLEKLVDHAMDNPDEAISWLAVAKEQHNDNPLELCGNGRDADSASDGATATEEPCEEPVSLEIAPVALPLAGHGYGQSPDHLTRRVDLQLEHSQRFAMGCILRACRTKNIVLPNGRKVERAPDVVRYLLELAYQQCEEQGFCS